jgi:LacI family transcriptional regulator
VPTVTTIYDIAKKAGVSAATVSKVLNNQPDVGKKTREKVLQISEELGYQPNATARGLATRKSNTIGVFFEDHLNTGFRHPFLQDILASFKDVVGAQGYDLIFFAKRNPEDFESLARYRDVDGIFLLGVPRTNPKLTSLRNSKIPCMSIDLDLLGPKAGYLISDNIGGAFQAVDYLVSMGHTDIAFISDVFSTKPGHDRLVGFHQSMAKHHLVIRPDWIVNGDFSEEGGYHAAQQLFTKSKIPTAIFSASDMMAIGAIRAIRENNLTVGEDVSIIGFDDLTLLRYITPYLTTIRQNKDEMGSLAANSLVEMMNNPNYVPTVMTVPTELVIRDTVKKIG